MALSSHLRSYFFITIGRTNSWGEDHGAKFFEASAAYQAADYATAFSTYQLLADYGDAAAQHNLGLMYENGLGVGQNMEQAMRWYRLAADQAFPPAVTRLNAP